MLRSWTESEKQRRARRQGEPATPDPLYLLEGHTPGPSGWVGTAATGPTTPRKPTVPPAREALGPEKPPLGRVARKGRAGASSPLPGPPRPSLRAEHADRPSSPDCSLARPLSRQVETQVWEREVGRRSGREQARRGQCCRLTAQMRRGRPSGRRGKALNLPLLWDTPALAWPLEATLQLPSRCPALGRGGGCAGDPS